jgi:hypothetical protein
LSKNLSIKGVALGAIFLSFSSCATSIKWEGEMSRHVSSYKESFDKFRGKVCQSKTEPTFDHYLLRYRGQGYWIPELNGDVDVETIRSLLPEMEKKLAWIQAQIKSIKKESIPGPKVTADFRILLKKLLDLKKKELSQDEASKVKSRQVSLKLQDDLKVAYNKLISKVSFFTNYNFPVDHLKNRKTHDLVRDKEDIESVKMSNFTFLYRKILEDGAYTKKHTASDIYLRTTLDTIHFELLNHGFYISEDARYDLEFVLSKLESELEKGKDRVLERLSEWQERTQKAVSFYHSLTLPDNQKEVVINGKKSTANRELIREHNRAANELKEFVYQKQSEVYAYWLKQSELHRAIYVLETILLNEVGGVDGDDALERMDVARVVLNRLDKPKYLVIGKKEFIYPYLTEVITPKEMKDEKWLNALFKQGEFSFTYYYMGGVAKIFCPDMSPKARKLREQNVEIALRVLKEESPTFHPTRYFSRASMIGRIHMDTIWEDYVAYPERPGLLASGQDALLKALTRGEYSYLYSFEDPEKVTYQVVEINNKVYSLTEKNGLKIFYHHRNPHYFRYFTKIDQH